MAGPIVPVVRIQPADFDVAAEIQRVAKGADVGAVVSFSGICRDEEGSLEALELEHYPGMAEAEIMRIANQAAARWPLTGHGRPHCPGRPHTGSRFRRGG